MKMKPLKIYKMFDDVKDVKYGTKHAACFDVHAYITPEYEIKVYTKNNSIKYPAADSGQFALLPSERAMIPTGLKFDIPIGYSVRVHGRSSLALKHGVTLANCEGVIDADFADPIVILLQNNSREVFHIKNGDRIAQCELVHCGEYDIEYVTEPPEFKGDRVGGWGSTGRS